MQALPAFGPMNEPISVVGFVLDPSVDVGSAIMDCLIAVCVEVDGTISGFGAADIVIAASGRSHLSFPLSNETTAAGI